MVQKVILQDVKNGFKFSKNKIDENGVVYGAIKPYGPLRFYGKKSKFLQLKDDKGIRRSIKEKDLTRLRDESFKAANAEIEKPEPVVVKGPTIEDVTAQIPRAKSIVEPRVIREEEFLEVRAQAMMRIDTMDHVSLEQLIDEARFYMERPPTYLTLEECMVDIVANRIMVEEELKNVPYDKTLMKKSDVESIMRTIFPEVDVPAYYVPLLAKQWATEIRTKYWDKISYRVGEIELRYYQNIVVNSHDLKAVISLYGMLIDLYGERN